MSRPYPSRKNHSASYIRVNGKIRAREVRVIGADNKQIGVISLNQALAMARQEGVDLVEISPNAQPPVCRLVDYGKFRYEQAKRDKESKKHQHASLVKEVQLSPRIDPHDLKIKVMHAVDFLCEDMKVKMAMRFRGREMAHTDVGFEVINRFLQEIAPYGHPDFQPKLVGRSVNLMISPLPRNKRAKNPRADEMGQEQGQASSGADHKSESDSQAGSATAQQSAPDSGQTSSAGLNNPFANLEIK